MLKAGFLDELLSDEIRQALRDSRKIESFYTHQAAAINAISHKKHVIVSTSTASGKSVIYQARAIFLRYTPNNNIVTGSNPAITGRRSECHRPVCIPNQSLCSFLLALVTIISSKALAQDQINALQQLLWSCPTLRHVSVATYDGDTPQERRAGK